MILPLILNLVSGAIGGNLVGKVFKNLDLGVLGNSISGILGGGIGGQLLNMFGLALGGSDASMDLSSILGSVATGATGGGILMAIVGMIKKVVANNKA